ncbi:hypothetical protein CEN49_02285 [Fischerella thermalis CCMEE 5273]|uniref:Uncharacterized protein n=1 Tax=Chlorogloeopsis fritschii PCC 6912 TaxID=211165 RepID=A0A433NLD5_CHLFR|nr:hypothetical protein [Chlorogloeopsis fritschii]PMB11166.1 hypothetical protein CEN49_02285 [Fischerella thermalis CCMEE 5273]PMB47371.1 hypothetical protein CEN40_08830 [Fischerella thermalis CCMEE 5205]RUR83713.1 hypothetical protein PCC6912_19560 [Chlorogloeopsis fritschii PCC 6912]
MNKKFLLALLSSPVVFTSLVSTLGVANPAHATQPVIRMKDGEACIKHPHGGYTFVCTRVSQKDLASRRSTPTSTVSSAQSSSEKIAMLDFTEEESNAAIQLFGCDCPYCMNSLRALRGQAPMVY